MRILLAEDDHDIGMSLRQGLQRAGYAVDWATDGRSIRNALSSQVYALAILDLCLPGEDGMTILRGLRSAGDSVPVLVASARDSVDARVAALEAGADDYLRKPFDLGELIARVRAVLRRHAGSGVPVVRVGDITLDPQRKQVTQAGNAVSLSAREFAILEALMRRAGTVLSRAALEDSVYGWGDEVCSNSVEVHVHHLRRKLGVGLIRTVRGLGYRIDDIR